MKMSIKICPVCVVVSSLWLFLSAGVAWGYLSSVRFVPPVALLMGGSVMGIAYLGEKRLVWAGKHQTAWKILIIGAGLILAYLAVTNLTKVIVLIELIILLIIAFFLFVKRASGTGSNENEAVRKIEEQMKQCC